METRLKCSAEQFKWLWAIRGIVEKIMLRECRTVAETFVGYCSRLAAEGAAKVPVRIHGLPHVRCHTRVSCGVLTSATGRSSQLLSLGSLTRWAYGLADAKCWLRV